MNTYRKQGNHEKSYATVNGIGMLLHEYCVPVVPVLLQGTYQALPPGGLLPHLGQITVRFGPPLYPQQLEREAEGDEPHERIARALHDHVAELSHVA